MNTGRFTRIFVMIVIAGLVAAGCGRKGPPVAPSAEPDEQGEPAQ